MNKLSTSRGPVPNVINFLGDHGTLVIRCGGQYFICTQTGWGAALGNRQFIKFMQAAPPSNIMEGHWGIVPGLVADMNWDGATLQAALDQWMDEHREYIINHGNLRPLRERPERRMPLSFDQMERMINKATAEVRHAKR